MKSAPYSQLVDDVLNFFDVNPSVGLSKDAALQGRERFGENVLQQKKATSILLIFFRQFLSPLMFILLLASLVNIFLGEYKDALVVLIAANINVLVGFLQEWRADRASYALQSYEVTHAEALREGSVQFINACELVPGDIVILKSGSRIPADIRLIYTADFSTNEALLTGESRPVLKQTEAISKIKGLADQSNMAFSGTHVLTGKARGVVVATGQYTQIGMIARLVGETEDEYTPLQMQIKRLSWQLAAIMGSTTCLVAIVGFVKSMSLQEVVTTSLALAVAAIPEGLLVAVTSILAIGMSRMLKRKALVRHLVAAETLGSVSVVCTDKTGTLTEGSMRVVRMITQQHDYSAKNGFFENTALERDDVKQALLASVLNNDADKQEEDFFGKPTETSLLKIATNIYDIDAIRNSHERVKEIPFSSKLKYMVTLHHTPQDTQLLIVKGAPEKVFAMCRPEVKKNYEMALKEMGSKGLRLLAIAQKEVTEELHSFEGALCNLDFLALYGIQDPLRAHAADTVANLKDAGIGVVIVTGDHKDTALSIARGVDISTKEGAVLTGSELDTMKEGSLVERISDITVFARVEPRHKIEIVKAWQKKGFAVAMTGDGVNDAPALKVADIGVALGSGSDVAQEIADMVLLDDNLSTIQAAVKEGRVIFDNIRKVITYLLTDCFSEIILVSFSIIVGLPIPFIASQIFWINLVTDGFPSLALTLDPAEPDIMKKSPRQKGESIISPMMRALIFIIGLITDIGLFILYYFLLKSNMFSLIHIRTIMFTAIAIDSLLYVFSVRSMHRPLWRANVFNNKWLLGAIGIGFSLQMLVVYAPFFQDLFSTVSLGLFEWRIIFGLALIKLTAIEITKSFFLRKEMSH